MRLTIFVVIFSLLCVINNVFGSIEYENTCICDSCCSCEPSTVRERGELLKLRLRKLKQESISRRNLQINFDGIGDFFDDPLGLGEIVDFFVGEIENYDEIRYNMKNFVGNATEAFNNGKNRVYTDVKQWVGSVQDRIENTYNKISDPFPALYNYVVNWLTGFIVGSIGPFVLGFLL